MKKAIFLDRDGTINIDNGYTYKVEDCKLLDDNIWTYLSNFRKKGYLLIITTNQAWIDRWYYNKNDFFTFMSHLEGVLWITFDWIYYCPYHPDFSWESILRKPNNGMILQAQKDFDIDLKKSFMIWDNLKDVESGYKSQCKTILINTQELRLKDTDIQPDYITNNWEEINNIILN